MQHGRRHDEIELAGDAGEIGDFVSDVGSGAFAASDIDHRRAEVDGQHVVEAFGQQRGVPARTAAEVESFAAARGQGLGQPVAERVAFEFGTPVVGLGDVVERLGVVVLVMLVVLRHPIEA
jgi:hypothetical protein